MSSPEPLIVPVGHVVGAHSGTATYDIRVGVNIHSLSEWQFSVWTFAHGTADVLGEQSHWRRTSVQRLARDNGLTEAAELINELIGLGLLVEFDPGSEQGLEFARTHRLMPLMLGLGNSPEDPSLFGIGLLNQPVLQVSHPLYDLWQWSTMDDTLWATCENAADLARRAGSTDLEFTDPERLLTGFLPALHAFVLTGAACIDVPVRLDSPPAR